MLVLLDTLLLSLAAGLWASAGARGWLQSAREAVLLLLLLIILAPASPVVWPALGAISPLTALRCASDAAYRVFSASFWVSLAAVHGVSWLLLIAAGYRLRRAMREGDGLIENFGAAGRNAGVERGLMADANDLARKRVFTLVAWKIGLPKMADTDDPIKWLVRRQRGIRAVIWAGVLMELIPYAAILLIRFTAASIMPFISFYGYVSLAFYVVEGCLFGWAASRFLVEARRTGELELLLTTPAGAKTIVSSLWNELRRLFFLPVIVLTVPNLALALYYNIASYSQPGSAGTLNYHLYTTLMALLSCVHVIISIGAMIWVGLWFGLRARSQASAIVWIVLLGRGVPYVIGRAGSFLLRLFVPPVIFSAGVIRFSSGIWVYLLSQVAVLFYYLWLIQWARRRLATDLTNPSSAEFGLSQSISEARAGLAALVDKARSWPRAPEA
jgi:hypothetical protein